jgi:AcrR family transcriptional regulator
MSLKVAAASQTRRFEQKREDIRDAAARLFNARGLRGATLSEVAQSVGLITTSVTYYYKKKDDLAAACLLRATEVIDEVIALAEREATPEAKLIDFLRRFFSVLAEVAQGERPQFVNFYDIFALTGEHSERVFAAYTDLFRRVRQLFRTDREPVLGRREQNARAHLLLHLTLWSRHWLPRFEAEDYRDAADRMADILIGGLAGQGTVWAPPALPDLRPRAGNPAEVSREAFLRAATRLVNEQGYHGASVERISARLNVTKGSFYHHNETKADLVSDCFERSFQVIRKAQQAAQAVGATGWDRLTGSSAALAQYQLSDHGPLLRYTALAAMPEGVRPQAVATLDRLSERFAAMTVDGMTDGTIRPVHPSIAAQLVAGMISAAADLTRWVPDAAPSDAADLFARPLFEGLLRPSRPC